MSIWGPNPFENDDAADWLAELDGAPSIGSIMQAIDEIADPMHVGYMEIPECCIAVAAGELLAGLMDGTSRDEPLSRDAWLKLLTEMRTYDAGKKRAMANQAYYALERVFNDAENSELQQNWSDSQFGYDTWAAIMRGLIEHLASLSRRPPGEGKL